MIMAQNLRVEEPTSPSVANLVGEIIADAQKLARQEIALVRTEMNEEWLKAKTALAMLSMTLASIVIAGMLLTFGAVHLLSGPIGVPLWLSFVIVAVVMAGISYLLYRSGRELLSKVNFVPRETVETLKENVPWIRNQT
jgi:hypothetical protein